MVSLPLILVVGGDELALRVVEELCATQGHRVALLWKSDPDLAYRVQKSGAEFLGYPPDEFESLRKAGVQEAASIMALSDDDRLNLQVALKARDVNPQIRVVLRQFNRALGRKIGQNLPNCSVVSLSGHAAATFAACAMDRSVFYAVQFPDLDGPLVAFATRTAREWGMSGEMTLADFETAQKVRVVGYNGVDFFPPALIARPDDNLLVFGEITVLENLNPPKHERKTAEREFKRETFVAMWSGLWAAIRRIDPILQGLAVVSFATFVVFSIYFGFALQKDVVTSIYFVITTMTSTGYGDITPLEAGPIAKLAANMAMVAGVAMTGIFIAFATERISRAQYVATQGVRPLRHRDHIVVCGTGQVGTRVIDFLLEHDRKVVVIAPDPDPTIIDRVRNREFALLTGDATREEVLAMCNLPNAHSLVAVTGNDTANLEVALGARALNPVIRVVMRVQDETFARLMEHQFSLDQTFSTSQLSAPGFAGLSRFPGTRGRIAYGEETYNVGERLQGEVPQPPPAQNCIPLCVWREGDLLLINDFDQMKPFDRLLFLVPLSQFKTKPAETKAAEMETAPAG